MSQITNLIKDIFKSIKPYKVNHGDSQGVSEISAVGYDSINSSVYAITSEKRNLSQEYKEMSMFPEVADAIDEIVFEAINPAKDGKIIGLKINDADLAENENVVDNLQKEFDYILDKVIDFNTNADDLFRKFFVEGELYGELLIDTKKKERGIVGLQILPAYSMRPEYDDKQNPIKFSQDLSMLSIVNSGNRNLSITNSNNTIDFSPSQIAYVNSGIIDYHRNLVYSYLERAKISFRQLKWMENALLIYRVTRAPERRVFNIEVGKLPKNKADEYIRALVNKNKNKKIYNPSTGEIDVGKEVQSMTEDFYFPTRDGAGSSVTTLAGGQNLGELQDVEYFLKKLYKALKVPAMRLASEGTYNPGRSGEITREEIKFSKYVNKVRARFLDFVTQIYLTHLQMKGLFEQYKLNKSKLTITFNEDNEWKELKNLEMLSARITIFKDMVDYKDEIFPIKYLYKEVMNLSDSEIGEMVKMLKDQSEGKAMVPDEEEPEETPEEDKEPKKNQKLLTGNPLAKGII